MIQKAVKDQKGPLRKTIMWHIWRYANQLQHNLNLFTRILVYGVKGMHPCIAMILDSCFWASSNPVARHKSVQTGSPPSAILYMNSSCLKDFKHFRTAFEHLSRIGPYPNAVHRLNGAGNRPSHVLPHQNLNSCGCPNLTAFSGETFSRVSMYHTVKIMY